MLSLLFSSHTVPDCTPRTRSGLFVLGSERMRSTAQMNSPVAQVLCKLNDSRKLAVLPLIKVLEALAAA